MPAFKAPTSRFKPTAPVTIISRPKPTDLQWFDRCSKVPTLNSSYSEPTAPVLGSKLVSLQGFQSCPKLPTLNSSYSESTAPVARTASEQAEIDSVDPEMKAFRDNYLVRLADLRSAYPTGMVPPCFATLEREDVVYVTDPYVHCKPDESILAIIYRSRVPLSINLLRLFPNAFIIDIRGCALKTLWGIEKLLDLTILLASHNELTGPKVMPFCEKLHTIDIRSNPLTNPFDIPNLYNLKEFWFTPKAGRVY